MMVVLNKNVDRAYRGSVQDDYQYIGETYI